MISLSIRTVLSLTAFCLLLSVHQPVVSANHQTHATGDSLYQPDVGQSGKDVIWVPTNDELVKMMLDIAKVKPTDVVYDLGAGDGKIAISAARDYGARAVGIEYNRDMAALAQRNADRSGVAAKVKIINGDIFVEDFSEATVEFTAPVFWGFLCLVGLALMRLRRIDPNTPRPFKVPFYPLLPIIFCLICAYLTYSSVLYAQSQGAIHVSFMVMAAGVVALWFLIVRQKRADNLSL